MWHMGTWDDPLVTRGGDTRSGRSVVPYTVHVPPARPRARSPRVRYNRAGRRAF